MPRKAVSPSLKSSTGRPVGRPSSKPSEEYDDDDTGAGIFDGEDVLHVYQGQSRAGQSLSSDDLAFA